MKKVYYLSTCSTCNRIIKELGISKEEGEFVFQDIKTEKITDDQLNQMRQLAGSYSALFSKVSRKYKELGLKNVELTEQDMKQYILDEYTFLKRPVFIVDEQIFVGNSKKVQAELAEFLNQN